MPYWRLSGFYFWYFAALGALVPYWGLYLQERGFSPLAIGQLMAILMATKVVAPNVWGWIADRTGKRLGIVRLASLLATVAFAGVFFSDGFWQLVLAMALFSFFWNASLPQFEALTFDHLGERVRRYATIRLWGSVGFILTVAGLGLVLDRVGTGAVPVTVLALFLCIWLASLAIPEPRRRQHPAESGSLLSLLVRPEVLALLSVCFLLQASHGAYYAFFSIYLEQHGYASRTIGALWALGVIAEVMVFLGMHRLLARFGARRVLLASLLLAVVRWLLIGLYPQRMWILSLAQTLHAATFGTFHASAIHLVHHYFTGRVQGRGQALYSSVSFGAGGAVGSLASGYLWTGVSPGMTFVLSSLFALLGLYVGWRWVDRDRRF